ncbi:hypothetical protein [Synechococcus sp. PCC 6312]|uniref:hypothetical protein n=1 Tax=Synechococcus sp. (strain ATCC 27167 / PCC 6312) TaxID=195253 RepID=UPI00059C181F|nr:hypothetical protein [Synechococcus sp. PCC 6312]
MPATNRSYIIHSNNGLSGKVFLPPNEDFNPGDWIEIIYSYRDDLFVFGNERQMIVAAEELTDLYWNNTASSASVFYYNPDIKRYYGAAYPKLQGESESCKSRDIVKLVCANILEQVFFFPTTDSDGDYTTSPLTPETVNGCNVWIAFHYNSSP